MAPYRNVRDVGLETWRVATADAVEGESMRTEYDLRRERQTKRLAKVVHWIGEYQLTNGERPKNYSFTLDADRSLAYFSACGVVWIVWDNGGEYGLEQVNMSEPVFFRVADYLDAATIAYRVACVVRGDEIDYSQDMSDCELPDAARAALSKAGVA